MAPNDRPEKVRQQDQRGDIKPCLLFGFSSDLTCAFNHHDGFQTGPFMAFSQPLDIVDDGGGSGLDPPVIGIDRGRPTDLCVHEIACLLLGNE
jgi:hypothetical protein